MRSLFVSDMDGTLLGADSRVSEASRQMLNEAVRRGAMFTVATARTPATVAPLLHGVDLRLPAIVMTGAATWHPGTGEYTDLQPLAAQTVERLLEVYDRRGLPTFVYTLRDGRIHVYHTGPLSDGERSFMAERLHSPHKTFHIPSSGVSAPPYTDGDVLLMFALRPAAQVEPVWRELHGRGDCSPVFYHDLTSPRDALLEVFSPAVSKAEAVRRLADRIGADRVVAFGDNINDIPMLRAADCAVAVENALPEVKAVADIVIGPNTADSVPRFILDHLDAERRL